MTKKRDVDFNTYRKNPRMLEKQMMDELKPGGDLHPILVAVAEDHQLRLEIRDRRFNVYYRGGNLMRVDGSKSPCVLDFDEKYFSGGEIKLPPLPKQLLGIENAKTWVEAFPILRAGMDKWLGKRLKKYLKSERDHCQEIASANSGMSGPPPGDYLVLDLEYEYGRRRFDMIAAKRRRTEDDATGWVEPDLVFIEVKSAPSACSGKSGLRDHALDYQHIIAKRDRQHVKDIKKEYEEVIAQKLLLGLLDKSLGFKCFSPVLPKLLLVFVDLDLNAPGLQTPLREVSENLGALNNVAHILFMVLDSNKTYVMH
jgi:predicted protein tyrosine phosphatase